MADDPNPELRAELLAALAVIDPQIRGLHDLAVVSISAELAAAIQQQIVERERRQRLLQAAIASLNAVVTALDELEADGYPALPDAFLDPNLLAELNEEENDLDAASGIFVPNVAAAISIDLGTPVEKSPAETP